jgi:hypothetical protein
VHKKVRQKPAEHPAEHGVNRLLQPSTNPRAPNKHSLEIENFDEKKDARAGVFF